MSDRILLPYDGSTASESALEYALETFPEAELTILYVVAEPDGYWDAFEDPETRIPGSKAVREQGLTILDDAEGRAEDHGPTVETEITIGKPKHEIVELAADGEYDTIVIGSHSRDGLSRILLGSVAEAVVRRSPIPVVVVR